MNEYKGYIPIPNLATSSRSVVVFAAEIASGSFSVNGRTSLQKRSTIKKQYSKKCTNRV